jgi:hypothetical protein
MSTPGTGGLPVPRIDQQRTYPASTAQAGSSANTFRGRLVVISGSGAGSGLFTYNGVPALGNPPIFSVVAPGVTTDPFGNTVLSLLNVGSLAGAHFGIDPTGSVYVANSAGKNIVIIDTATGSAWFYNSSGGGAGNLVVSIAAAAGTDYYGNAYKAGLEIQGAGDVGQSILLGLVGGIAELQMPTGETIEGAAANLFTSHVGAGAAEFLQTGFSGPRLNVAGFTDWAQWFLSSSTDGGPATASGTLVYINDAQTPSTQASWDKFGFNVPTLNRGWAAPSLALVGNTAVQTIFATSPIPVGQPGPGSLYEMTIDAEIQGGGVAESLSIVVDLSGTAFTGGGFIGATNYATGDVFTLTVRMQCLGPLGASCKWRVLGFGDIKTSAGTLVSNIVIGPGTDITVSSLVTNNLNMRATWGGAGGAGQFLAPIWGKFRQVV